MDALRAQGVLVEPVASVARPGLPRGTRLRLTGGGLNRPAAVESYPSRAAAVEASRMRGPDLRGRDRRVRWFGTGHLVVRYAGTDPVAVALLTDVLGPPLHASGGAARAR